MSSVVLRTLRAIRTVSCLVSMRPSARWTVVVIGVLRVVTGLLSRSSVGLVVSVSVIVICRVRLFDSRRGWEAVRLVVLRLCS